MSWLGLRVAKTFGQKLPAFASPAQAEAHLLSERDERLRRMTELTREAGSFVADLSPESLKGLEGWYFSLCESDGFASLGVPRDEFERCMAVYFCAVAVQNCPDTKWVVEEYAFERGRYELGVQHGSRRWMRSRFADHFRQTGNKRREKIYREYQQFFGT